ncbi:MAG: YfcC family protein, partial [Alphaproteobacteria bacterium]|nr:YfcC family protein [Alphaproteobacteria bacterium]
GSLPLSFLVGGGAAGTALTMPVLAPLGDFAGVDRALVITTWAAAAGWLRLIVPVNAILIAGLALANVSFDRYLRFMAPLMGIMLVVIIAVLLFGVLL